MPPGLCAQAMRPRSILACKFDCGSQQTFGSAIVKTLNKIKHAYCELNPCEGATILIERAMRKNVLHFLNLPRTHVSSVLLVELINIDWGAACLFHHDTHLAPRSWMANTSFILADHTALPLVVPFLCMQGMLRQFLSGSSTVKEYAR